ncbi:FAD:protein FMN transferase [Leifsonia sp. 2MCAF36]|uniref:FAD:protein FMN transferase n=1 Tax=Leifsonia sp. 2MCAF36 TaxID=3232988 RepID=UPI003F94ACB3
MASRPGPDAAFSRSEWMVWGTVASIVVDCEERLADARLLAESVLGDITAACSRFEPTSELSRISADPRASDGVEVSALLADLIAAALNVARETGGSVDPSLGADLEQWGYDRDFDQLRADASPLPSEAADGSSFALTVAQRRDPGWRRIHLDGRLLTVPADVRIDLGATAKAFAADLIARRVAEELTTGVLVSLGGDIATAGSNNARGWEILVQDLDTDPAQQVFLPSGSAMATSSTQKRRWMHDGRTHQHILDPAFGTPVIPEWRSVTVAAATCLRANALSTASIVRGRGAVAWLAEQGADARLVDLRGRVVTVGAWPAPDEAAPAPENERVR